MCMAGGRVWQGGDMCGGGHVWQGRRTCAWQGGMCTAGGMCGRGHVWQGCVCGRGVCVAGGVHEGHVWQGDMCAGETAIEVGGTHPTGLHSCSICVSQS